VSEAVSGGQPARSFALAALAAPPVGIVLLALGLALSGGGVGQEQWAQYAVAIPAGVAVLAAVGAMPAVPRRALPALGAAAAFAGWSALSLVWSEAPGDTAETLLRTLLLVTTFAVGVVYAARPTSAVVLASAVGLAGVVVALAIVVRLFQGDDTMFVGGRLSWPIVYANGASALLFLPGCLLFAFAAASRLRPAVRAGAGAGAALVIAVGLLCASRGGTLALLGALAVVVATSRPRPTAGIVLLCVLMPLAPVAGTLARSAPASDGAMAALARDCLIVAVVAGALVLAIAMAERRDAFPCGPYARRVAATVWIGLALVGGAVVVSRAGNPVSWVEARWTEFSHVGGAVGDLRFASASSNRYDYWRVAAGTWTDHPVLGVGAGAFPVPWFQRRAVDESVTDAHSWVFGALAELGLPGFVLLTAFFALPAIARPRSAITPLLLGGGAFVVLDAAVDWSLTLPALALPGALLLGAGLGDSRDPVRSLAGGRTRAVTAVVALLVVVLAVPGYLAAKRMDTANARAATDPAAAVDLAASAADLAPLAAAPLLQASAIALGDGDAVAALRYALEATDREPKSWTAWARVERAAAAAGDGAVAAAAAARVKALNPRFAP
jgi:hypothetical protein